MGCNSPAMKRLQETDGRNDKTVRFDSTLFNNSPIGPSREGYCMQILERARFSMWWPRGLLQYHQREGQQPQLYPVELMVCQ
ncbi:hypothetical protein E2C01_048948 [Portunus trituberculatus]|uniref:Uncharacterized protein n=1 Tax=Portunus trituberculatus TaxID=210409 RepID=A0A5B7GCW8_PORTR|nr:hypothetical protein [Portunus trituberculatus]